MGEQRRQSVPRISSDLPVLVDDHVAGNAGDVKGFCSLTSPVSRSDPYAPRALCGAVDDTESRQPLRSSDAKGAVAEAPVVRECAGADDLRASRTTGEARSFRRSDDGFGQGRHSLGARFVMGQWDTNLPWHGGCPPMRQELEKGRPDANARIRIVRMCWRVRPASPVDHELLVKACLVIQSPQAGPRFWR